MSPESQFISPFVSQISVALTNSERIKLKRGKLNSGSWFQTFGFVVRPNIEAGARQSNLLVSPGVVSRAGAKERQEMAGAE